MKKVLLDATKRDVFGKKTSKGRRQGLIPAVVYGKGIETEPVWIKDLDFRRMLNKSGESMVINLSIDGNNDRNVVIYEIQEDPVKNRFLHVDFFQVRMDEEIETEVELVFVGEAPAVKELGGVLVKNMDNVTVKCLPGDLPGEIQVDISSLRTFDDYIYVKDLNVSKKVEFDLDPETVVALVSPPRSEEELEKLEEKVEEDVTKVEGVVKEVPASEENKEK